MDEQQDQQKDEAATPYKLEEARKQGNVAKSPEVVSAAAIGIAMLGAYAFVERALAGLSRFQSMLLTAAFQPVLDTRAASHLVGLTLLAALEVLAPFFFALICAAVVANLLQTGPVFSTDPLKVDFQRLDLRNGFKRLFSFKVLFDLGKSIIKLVFFSTILYFALKNLLPSLTHVLSTPIDHYPRLFSQFSGALLFKLFIAMVLVATLDFMFTRWEFLRKMRMSRREIRDEHKQREGDPRLRKRIRELQREMGKRTRALKQVPNASVVVTNPTRVAVAITYDSRFDPAPRLVAKGAGEMARHIRLIANQHRVPVIHSPRLARALYRHVEFDHYIPEEWHPLLARILVWIARRHGVSARSGTQ